MSLAGLPLRIGARAEKLHRLVLRRGRERDEGDAAIVGPCRHLGRQDVFRADFAAVVQFRQFLGLNTAFNLAAASPVCELWASSAMTAKRLPWVAANSRTASKAKGKVWMVQTTIFLSPDKCRGQFPALAAVASCDRGHHAAWSAGNRRALPVAANR